MRLARRAWAGLPTSALFLRAGRDFELVAECPVVAPFETAVAALAFARLDQVLEAPGSQDGRLATLGATLVTLHPKLVLSLARDAQTGELILNRCSHGEKS